MRTIDDQVLVIEDLVSLYEAPTPRAERVRSSSRASIAGYQLGRRQALKAAATVGTSVGLMSLGVFPKAKEAAAACVGFLENKISGPCPVNVGNCSPACGPSMPYADACGSNNYHKYTGDYRNRPDQCNDVAEADGWIWSGINCCGGPGCARRYRCHDGCKRISGQWRNSICRYALPGCLCP